MRVLITGTSGRIGAAVATRIARQHRVTGVDLVAGPLTAFVGDISDAGLVDRCVAGQDAVIHCAALHAPHVGTASDAQFVATNVDGTRLLLTACRRHAVRRFVLTSSTSVYGNAMVADDRAVWVDESLEPEPRDIYDRTKLDAEALCRDAADSGVAVAILRMSRSFPEPPHLIAIYRLYRGVDARDVARAHELALLHEIDGCLTLNISARSPFRPADLQALYDDAAATIARYHPWAHAAFASRGWTLPSRIDRVYAIDRARTMLGFEPIYNFASLFDRGDGTNG